jgi:acyl transferase domain-containing protein
MKRMLVAVVLLASSLGALAADAQQIPLRNPRETVAAVYASINQVGADRKEIYGSQTPDMQADLWLFQIEEFLAANPPLNAEQRALTMETIGMLSSGALQRYASPDPAVAARAREEYAAIAQRGMKAFSRAGKLAFTDLSHEAVRAALTTLFNESVSGMQPPASPRTPARQRVTENGPDYQFECNCYSATDTCGFTDCVPSPLSCIRKPAGCGWNWSEPCNGWCNV